MAQKSGEFFLFPAICGIFDAFSTHRPH